MVVKETIKKIHNYCLAGICAFLVHSIEKIKFVYTRMDTYWPPIISPESFFSPVKQGGETPSFYACSHEKENSRKTSENTMLEERKSKFGFFFIFFYSIFAASTDGLENLELN